MPWIRLFLRILLRIADTSHPCLRGTALFDETGDVHRLVDPKIRILSKDMAGYSHLEFSIAFRLPAATGKDRS